MPLKPSDDLPQGKRLKSLHFQAMINPADDKDVYEWLLASRRNYSEALGSIDRAILIDMVRHFIRMETAPDEPRSVNVDVDRVDDILGALQTIQEQLTHGATKTGRGGKKQKEVELTPNLLNMIGHYEAFGERADEDE